MRAVGAPVTDRERPSLTRLEGAASARGLVLRGAFHVRPADAVPPLPAGAPARTLVLLGNVGSSLWQAFSRSGFRDGRPDPLDRWSREVVEELAGRFGGAALFPFGGPPVHPFLRWAARAEPVSPSRMGPFIHPRYGLWHAYRGALAFAEALDLPRRETKGEQRRGWPCATCQDSPCLAACPVDAISEGHYDVPRCVAYLRAHPESACMRLGCRARRACPVGAGCRYRPAQARHHMEAFVASHARGPGDGTGDV